MVYGVEELAGIAGVGGDEHRHGDNGAAGQEDHHKPMVRSLRSSGATNLGKSNEEPEL